jgi:uncharacterized protein (TIGR03118 family)
MTIRQLLLIGSAFCAISSATTANDTVLLNHYLQTNLLANKSAYKATFETDSKFINAWGIAIRPAGAGGHFWVTAKDISYEYVGDVKRSADEKLRNFHADELKYVTLPVGGDDKFATGTVFSGSKEHFIITQEVKDSPPITAPAKFLFASDGGIISAWTERKKEDGTFDRSGDAMSVIDESKSGAQFFGIAISSNYDRLYAADFGAIPAVKVYDGNFKPADVMFDMPYDENKNGKVDAGEYAPFNVQALPVNGASHIFVTYAMTQACPDEEVKADNCKEGEIFAGEEDTSKAGMGRLAQFTEDGKLVRIWKDGGKLSAPWGLAIVPDNFGALSGALLVSNFGDGTIAAYDIHSSTFKDVMRNAKGKPIIIDKIWGILFGNGESLGDKDALYFASGPKDETDGLFGSLRVSGN